MVKIIAFSFAVIVTLCLSSAVTLAAPIDREMNDLEARSGTDPKRITWPGTQTQPQPQPPPPPPPGPRPRL
jgi:hypothetical protein